MKDSEIIDLYWQRSELAIACTAEKYNGYCYTIACNILGNPEDAEESVNDTYLAAWNSIPPKRPTVFQAFLGKITRYISLDRWRKRSRAKRGGGEPEACLEELQAILPGTESVEDVVMRKELLRFLNRFLGTLEETERNIFVCRYWYLDPVDDIAARFGFSHSKTASTLRRTRKKIHQAMLKEGFL